MTPVWFILIFNNKKVVVKKKVSVFPDRLFANFLAKKYVLLIFY